MLYEVVVTLVAPVAAVLMCFSKRGRERIYERFGFLKATGDFWGHGASVGEVKGLMPILKNLTSSPFITSVSPTAKNTALLPFDSRVFLKGVFNQIKPKALIISESDIWPVLINETYKRDIPIFYVNARVTEDGLKRIKKSNLLTESLKKVKFFFCEDEKTKIKLRSLGFENTSVAGNAKYEVQGVYKDDILNFINNAPREFITLGSIHPGEEKVLFPVIKEFLNGKILVIAPRHRERLKYFEEILKKEFSEVSKFSERKWGRVLLIDTFGDLGAFLENSFLAVICGSFIPGIGGHNPLEAKMVPTVVGQFHEKVSSVVLPNWVGVDKIKLALEDIKFREKLRTELIAVYNKQCGVGKSVASKILEMI